MADTKITGLTALAAAPAVGDLFVLVDVSDTTMSADGTDKKITTANLFTSPTFAGTANFVDFVASNSGANFDVRTATVGGGTALSVRSSGNPAFTMFYGGPVVAQGVQYLFTSSTSSEVQLYDAGLTRYAAGVIRSTNGTTGISGFMGGGAAVASATALPLPTGRVFHVTGTTTVTSITSTNFVSGAVITLIFDGILTFTDGNNLKLAGDFVTSADDTITLVFDGTNWYEIARSVN